MSLCLQYQPVPLNPNKPRPPSLSGGLQVRWRPLVRVRITGPRGSRQFDQALLDTGADDTIFPLDIVSVLGVKLQPDTGHRLKWRGTANTIRYGRVDLELADGNECWRWPAVVGFSSAPIPYPLLGNCGCLQFMDATFLGTRYEVRLDPNAAYPGTIV